MTTRLTHHGVPRAGHLTLWNGGTVRRWVVLIATLGSALLLGPPALAQDLAAGRAQYLEAQSAKASATFLRLLRSPNLDRETALEAHRHLATLNLVRGDDEQARRHAAVAVAFDREVQPPAGAPPEATALFDSVRAEQPAAARLAIDSSQHEPMAGTEVAITATLAPAHAAMVSHLRLRCAGAGVAPVEATAAPPRVDLSLIPGGAATNLSCNARAETTTGAVLFEAGLERRIRHRGRRIWAWLVGLAGAVVLSVVTAMIVTAAMPPDTAYVHGPTVVGW